MRSERGSNRVSEYTQRVYLYAIVDHDATMPTPITGLAGAPVTLLPVQALAAAISPVEMEMLKDTAAAALVHEEVVDRLLADRRVLPVRFGTVFSSVEALTAALRERHSVLVADLARLDGQVEIGVRLLWDGDARRTVASEAQQADDALAASSGPGSQYLRMRMQEVAVERRLRQQAAALAMRCEQVLAPFATALNVRVLATRQMPVSIACLVARNAVAVLVDAVATLHDMEPDIRVVCTGPWPPYHFVSDSQGES